MMNSIKRSIRQNTGYIFQTGLVYANVIYSLSLNAHRNLEGNPSRHKSPHYTASYLNNIFIMEVKPALVETISQLNAA